METTTELFFACIRSAVCGMRCDDVIATNFHSESLPELYTLARSHDMAHLVAAEFDRLGFLGDDAVSVALQKSQMTAVYRYEQLRYTLETLCAALEECQIPFLPLKGAVIRSLYPEPWMRTSCDIDVLVHESDLDAAVACVKATHGCKAETRSTHDVSLFTDSGVHIELHYNLVEDGRALRAADCLNRIWEYTETIPQHGFQKRMTDAAFCFYHIAHMVKHFEEGGCGIRPFVDLWLLERGMDALEKERCRELLRQAGLLTFAEHAEEVARMWLEGIPAGTVGQQLGDLILRSGIYGTSENRETLEYARRGGKWNWFWTRFFLPYDALKTQYPVLLRHKWMMPICQVRRWFRLLFGGKARRSVQKIRLIQTMSEDQRKSAEALLKALEL